MNFEEVLQVLASLEREGVDYAVFGAIALNLHGLVRATEDVDLFVRPDGENLERMKRAFKAVYDDPSIDEIDTGELLTDYPAVRYFPEGSELYFDVLTRLGEAFSWQDLEIETVRSGAVEVRVVSPRTLLRMKADTVRQKDRQDAQWLRETFGVED